MTDPTGEHEADGTALARQIAKSYRGLRPRKKGKPARRRSSETKRSEGEDAVAVGKVVQNIITEYGWEKELSIHTMFNRWAQLVGPEVAAHTKPISFHDGHVTVQADSTAWATQMRLLAPNIVAKLNASLGDGTVLRIDVQGPHAPSWKRGPRTVRGRGPRDTYG